MPYKDKKKQREYQRVWKDARRKKWLAENGPCVKCGSWRELEVDHIDPKTKTMHRLWTYSEARRIAELAKCQILCRSCHKKKTFVDFGWGKHGATRYRCGCRCDICRAAHAARVRKWKRAQRLKAKAEM